MSLISELVRIIAEQRAEAFRAMTPRQQRNSRSAWARDVAAGRRWANRWARKRKAQQD